MLSYFLRLRFAGCYYSAGDIAGMWKIWIRRIYDFIEDVGDISGSDDSELSRVIIEIFSCQRVVEDG